MGNKLGVSSSHSIQPNSRSRSRSLQRSNSSVAATRSGSTESLSTFVSLNSHADQCLLKDRFTRSMDDSMMMSNDFCESQLHSDTSTILTTLDDLCYRKGIDNSYSAMDENRENLRIPEALLKKLTTEDWNDLVRFICSSMEQSLQSNILQRIDELRDKNQTQSLSSSSSSHTVDNNRVLLETVPSPAENLVPVPSATRRTKHWRKPRPLSMPLVSSSLLDDAQKDRDSTVQRSRSPPKNVLESNNKVLSRNAQSRHRSLSNAQHKVHFVDSRLTSKTGSRSSLDNLELTNSTCKHLEGQKGYVTLDQLKDLGISLPQDSSSKVKCEELSSFSMKCWHGDGTNHQSSRRRPKRRQRKRSMSRNRHEVVPIAQKQKHMQLEQLCLLGPNTTTTTTTADNNSTTPVPVSSPESTLVPNSPNNDASLTNTTTTTHPSPSPPPVVVDHTSSSDVSTAPDVDVKVEHLHEHNHHHYHHFIHHSISQPADLCGKAASYSKPVHLIVSESQ